MTNYRHSGQMMRNIDMLTEQPAHAIIYFSFPLIAGSLLQQLYSIADALIVSRFVGTNGLGSIGATSSIQFLTLGFCIGCCGGLTIPVAQSIGAGDTKKTENYIANAGVSALVMSLLLTILFAFSTEQILNLLKTPEDLYLNAKLYLLILFLGIPCTIAYNLGAGILRASGNSKLPFFYLAICSVFNVVLDYLLVAILNYGVQGAAISTVLSQGIGGILCFQSVIKLKMVNPKDFFNNVNYCTCRYLFAISVPMGLQYSVTAIGTIFVQSANNALGSVYTTAFATGSKIRQFFMCPFDAFASATSVFAAQNLGAQNNKRVQSGVVIGVSVGIAYGIVAGIILFTNAGVFSSFFLGESGSLIQEASTVYLRRIGEFLWLLGILNVCRMSIQGLGYTRLALISGIVELSSRILLCYIWVPLYKFKAICVNEPFAWVCASVYVAVISFVVINKLGRGSYENV